MARPLRRRPHPEDPAQLGPDARARLRTATHEVGWLLDRGYAARAAGTLVGDHHQLTARQRRAVMRCACGARAAARRHARRLELAALAGAPLWIDGFNVLLTVEAAFGGAPLLRGQDGCLRDMVSLNGRFSPTDETARALAAIADALAARPPSECVWLFDQPVPHSGQAVVTVEAFAKARALPWRARTVANPDPVLKAVDAAVASADGAIIEVSPWVPLANAVVARACPEAWIVDLGDDLTAAS